MTVKNLQRHTSRHRFSRKCTYVSSVFLNSNCREHSGFKNVKIEKTNKYSNATVTTTKALKWHNSELYNKLGTFYFDWQLMFHTPAYSSEINILVQLAKSEWTTGRYPGSTTCKSAHHPASNVAYRTMYVLTARRNLHHQLTEKQTPQIDTIHHYFLSWRKVLCRFWGEGR